MSTCKTVKQCNECNIGIDVSKDKIHIGILPDDIHEEVSNNEKKIKRYFEKNFKGKKVGCIIMEATGGYEKKAADTLSKMGYYVCVINPRRAHHWKDVLGINPKTDKCDAQALAIIAQHFGGQKELFRQYQPPTENQLKLRQFVDRVKQLTEDSVCNQNRIAHAKALGDPNVKSMKKILNVIEKEKKVYLQKIRELIASDADLKEMDEILQSVPGVGIGTSAMLMAYLPELGILSRQEIASLAGLAPHPNDSGVKTGQRNTKCGRTKIKSYWMSAMLTVVRYNPKIHEYYNRLVDKGKPKRLALIASMRKLLTILNVMVHNKQKWNEHKTVNSETNQNEPQATVKPTAAPAKKTSTTTKNVTTIKSVASNKKTRRTTKTKTQRGNIGP